PLVYAGVPTAERRSRAMLALSMVGLRARADHRPAELSGGQQQRVAVARALVTRPALILADEPTGNLDSRRGKEIMALFQELHAGGTTVILVTHDPGIAAASPRLVSLKDGRVVSDGAPEAP
ncbi:MAG: ATP-binding cassette domain-containing protein, partial [Elusimicrobia bacterium]|nr:ATP-binding cassette domain-containing protein [Elusimicrobiota bacterium]